jgi:hypothetical protein
MLRRTRETWRIGCESLGHVNGFINVGGGLVAQAKREVCIWA